MSAGAEIDPTEMRIITGGNLVLEGGTGVNTAAKIINAGDIVMRIGGNTPYTYTDSILGTQTTLGGGLIIIGGVGSGIFNGQNLELSGTDLPVQATFTGGGGLIRITDASRASAYIQTGVNQFDTSLLNYLIFAANEETRTSRVRAGLGGTDDSNLPSCN